MSQIFDYLKELEIFEELAPIICISFIGSCIHEYVFKVNTQQHFLFNINIWISTLVSSIISFAIDPWILDFNPRLVFLPPLIIGLSGMDLVNKLTTLKGSSKVIEFFLGFVGLNRKNDNDHTLDDNKEISQDYDELESILLTFYNIISKILSDYYTKKNVKEFLKIYPFIQRDFDILRTEFLHYKMIPINLTLIISAILKKKLEIEMVYNKITR